MVIIALALLLHSPLLDVNRLSVKNQVERLLSGQVSVKDFDRNLHWRDREVCQNEADCILLAVNLDGDDDREYLLLPARNSIKQLHVYDIQGTQCDVRVMYFPHDMWLSPEELVQALEIGQIATRPSMLRDIQIGERRFSFSP